MNERTFTARDVLEQLDDDARRHAAFFPDFDHGYHYHIDGRLAVYGDENRWAIVIEQLSVNPRAGSGADGVCLNLYYHGTGEVLPPQEDWGEHSVLSIRPMSDGPFGPLSDPDTLEVNLEATDVRVRDEVVQIRTDPNYYWARKIDTQDVTHEQIDAWIEAVRVRLPPESAEQAIRSYESLRKRVGQFHLDVWHLVRGMAPEHREALLATEVERRRGIASGLRRLLLLDEWDHPDLMKGELPSHCESFKQIAQVLATGQPELWQPTVPSNVHWSNWPQSGSL